MEAGAAILSAEGPAKKIRAELIISSVLRYGVLLCAFILALGVVLMLVKPGTGSLLAEVRAGDDAKLKQLAPHTVDGFTHGLATLDPNTIIAVGLVLLIALPIVRVGLTTLIFILERDRIYIAVTAFVLVVLLTGIFLGRTI